MMKLWSGRIAQDQFEVTEGLRSARNDSDVYFCLIFREYVLQASHLLQFSFKIIKSPWGHWQSCWKTGYYISLEILTLESIVTHKLKKVKWKSIWASGCQNRMQMGAFDVRYAKGILVARFWKLTPLQKKRAKFKACGLSKGQTQDILTANTWHWFDVSSYTFLKVHR